MTRPIRAALAAALLLAAVPGAPRAADDVKKEAHDTAVLACLDDFKKAPKTSDEEKAAAVKILARQKDPRLLNALIPLLADPNTVARIDAIKAIGAYAKNPVASQALVSALKAAHKEPEVEVAALKALGQVKDWSTAPTVIDFFNDGEPGVDKAAIAAAGEIKSPDFVKELIDILRDTGRRGGRRGNAVGGGGNRRHHAEAQQALEAITGEAKAASAEDWENWWKIYSARVTEKLKKEDQEARERAKKEEAGG
jgi:HEAT repeat protein